MEESHTLGIDFGTTYSCICTSTNGGIIVIPNGLGERTTPSVVIFENKNQVYVGEETLNHLSKKNCAKIYEIKRLIGKKYSEIEKIKDYFAFTVIKKKEDLPMIKITFDDGKTSEYTPEYIACLIFKKLISNAENFLNQKITDVVVTVPADFNDIQRHAVKLCVESIPGKKVLKIINEPSAAALAYGFYGSNDIGKNVLFNFEESLLGFTPPPIEIKEKNKEKISIPRLFSATSRSLLKNNKEKPKKDNEKHFLVFDFGGGTYDVSIIEMYKSCVETLASSGDQMLGGGDIDNKLMEYCLNRFSEETKKDKEKIKKNYKSIQRLKIACEQAKIFLSKEQKDKIFIEDFYEEEPLDLEITRAKFEELCKEIFDKLLIKLDFALEDAKKKGCNKIDEIILVGGSSKMPKIKEILKNKFGENIPINDFINPDEIVAYGAALCSEKLVRSNNELLKNFNYIDSTQHSYGIEVEDGIMEFLLQRGSNYPSSITKYFHNYSDNQSSFEIKVYEGENKLCRENKLLGKFILKNIPKKKKEELILTVTFGIDINQILKVSAYVAENNTKNGIDITNDNLYLNKKKITFQNLDTIEIDLDGKEKQLKSNMEQYSKRFSTMKDDKNKYLIIKNYNATLIEYLTFLQEKLYDIESNKYLLLIEYLFKSYSYILTKFSDKILSNEKQEIKEKISKYLKLISIRKPFKLKQLIIIFECIKIEISDLFYSTSINCMEILKEKAENYLKPKTKNSSTVAKNFYEECINIANYSFKNEVILDLIDPNLKDKYEKIREECEKKIKILSIEFHNNEIENTKKTGKLFSDSNLDKDNLCLLSLNISQTIKTINSINNLYKNKEALEEKSICLATIVKIEFSMKERIMSLKYLMDKAEESIDIVENKLDKKYKKKEWYNEIVDLRNQIKEKINSKSVEQNRDENIREEFEKKYLEGNEVFLKFLVEKYPYKEFNSDDDIIGEFRKNKRRLLNKLISAYSTYDTDFTPLNNNINNSLSFKKEIILEYLSNIKNALTQPIEPH